MRMGRQSAVMERGGLAARPVWGPRQTARVPWAKAPEPALRDAHEFVAMPNITRWFVSGAIFIAVSRVHGFFPILAILRAPLVLSVLGMLMLFGTMDSWRPGDLAKHWIPRLAGLILLIAILGTPFGIYPGQSFGELTQGFTKSLMFMVMVWASARTPSGARFMVKTLASATVVASAMALSVGQRDSSGRLAGGYTYDANDIALVAVVGIPLCIWWLLDKTNRFRGAVLAATPLLLYLVVQSKSRGGFLALVAVLGAILVLGLRGKNRQFRQASGMIAVLVALSIPLLPGGYLDTMRTINDKDDYNRTSPTGRIETWKRGMGYAFSHPLTGVGIGNFKTAEGTLSAIGRERASETRGWKWSTAHNSFVLAAAELGLIGGAAFVILVVGSIVALLRLGRSNGDGTENLLPPLLGISILGFAVAGYFLSWTYYDLTWALFGLAAAVLMGSRSHAETAPVIPESLRSRRR